MSSIQHGVTYDNVLPSSPSACRARLQAPPMCWPITLSSPSGIIEQSCPHREVPVIPLGTGDRDGDLVDDADENGENGAANYEGGVGASDKFWGSLTHSSCCPSPIGSQTTPCTAKNTSVVRSPYRSNLVTRIMVIMYKAFSVEITCHLAGIAEGSMSGTTVAKARRGHLPLSWPNLNLPGRSDATGLQFNRVRTVLHQAVIDDPFLPTIFPIMKKPSPPRDQQNTLFRFFLREKELLRACAVS